MSTELMMPSNHLFLCRPLLLLPSILWQNIFILYPSAKYFCFGLVFCYENVAQFNSLSATCHVLTGLVHGPLNEETQVTGLGPERT